MVLSTFLGAHDQGFGRGETPRENLSHSPRCLHRRLCEVCEESGAQQFAEAGAGKEGAELCVPVS